jgi:hypothetical protein
MVKHKHRFKTANVKREFMVSDERKTELDAMPERAPEIAPAPIPNAMTIDDLYWVLAVKHPGFDIRIITDADNGLKVSVPNGFVVADRNKVESFTNRNDLRAYVDTLKVQ